MKKWYHKTLSSHATVLAGVVGVFFVFIFGTGLLSSAHLGFAQTLSSCDGVTSCRAEVRGLFLPVCIPDLEGANEACCTYTLDAFIILAINITKFILGITGSLALVFFMYGGFLYLTSGGDTKKIQEGTSTIINASIGVGLILGSWMIVNVVMGVLIQGRVPTSGITLFNNSDIWSNNVADACRVVPAFKLGEVADLPTIGDAPSSPTASSDSSQFATRGSQSAVQKTGQECIDYCTPSLTVSGDTKQYVKQFDSKSYDLNYGKTAISNDISGITDKKACTCHSISSVGRPSGFDCGKLVELGGEKFLGQHCSSSDIGMTIPSSQPQLQGAFNGDVTCLANKNNDTGKCYARGFCLAANLTDGGDPNDTVLYNRNNKLEFVEGGQSNKVPYVYCSLAASQQRAGQLAQECRRQVGDEAFCGNIGGERYENVYFCKEMLNASLFSDQANELLQKCIELKGNPDNPSS